MKFKVGDRVKFIGNSNTTEIPQDSLGTVKRATFMKLYPYEVSFDFDESPMNWPMNEHELGFA